MKEVVVSSDGIPISFESHGEGMPTLVFVHGWSCDRTYWKRQLEHFSVSSQVVAMDLGGHGESGLGRQEWTMMAFGEDVKAVVEKLGLKDTVLIGHSMGGDVIVEAARLMPDRVRGLVWVDTYRTLGKTRTDREIEESLTPFRANFVEATQRFVRRMFIPSSDASLVDRVATDMSAAPPEVALKTMKTALAFGNEIPSRLRELKAPVVAINPDWKPTDVEVLRRYGVSVVVMPGVGHFAMMEAPERFNGLLTNVIKRFSRQN